MAGRRRLTSTPNGTANGCPSSLRASRYHCSSCGRLIGRLVSCAALLCCFTLLTPQLVAAAAGAEDPAEAVTPGPLIGPNDRIAWSADGNQNDPDDWGATAVALAIFAKMGWQDRVVHIDYNNWLPNSTPLKAAHQTISVIEGAQIFGFTNTKLFDHHIDHEAAIANMVAEVNRSSADSRLWYVQAGPFEAAMRALEQADPAKLPFVTLVSHSPMNERSDKWPGQRGKEACLELGVGYYFTTTQGGEKFGSRRFKRWGLIEYLAESPSPEYRWVHSRIRAVALHKENCIDASDGGMAYVLATGDTDGNFNPKLRDFLGDGWRPDADQEAGSSGQAEPPATAE